MFSIQFITSPANWALKRVDSDGSQRWIAAISFDPIMKSLSIDQNEQYIYLGGSTSPLDVIRFSTDTGSIVDAQRQ